MNPYDDNDGALSVALADLADTMPDDPDRVEGIYARARRNRNRRRATRAGVGVLVGAATIVGLIAIRPGPRAVSTVPASPSTEPAPALPACSTLPPPPLSTNGPSPSADEARKAAADAARASRGTESAVDKTGVKGYGTVTAVDDASITVTMQEPVPGVPADITAAFTATTSFYDGSTEVTARPAVNTGDTVAFAAVVNDTGGYDLLLLNAHFVAPEAPTSDATPAKTEGTDAEKAAAAQAAPDSSFAKGIATVTAVQPDSLALDFTYGPLAGQSITATLGPDTEYSSGDQKCADPAFAAGQHIGIALHHDDAGTYTALAVSLFQ